MKAFTAALALHTLFGLVCVHRAAARDEWGQGACAFLVASSGIYLICGMLRALRNAEAKFKQRDRADERRRAFRDLVKADHRRGAGARQADSSTARAPVRDEDSG